MQSDTYTSAHVAHRVDHVSSVVQDRASEPTRTDRVGRQTKHVFQGRMRTLVRNPLFLIVVTWLVMATLLVIEIAGGK